MAKLRHPSLVTMLLERVRAPRPRPVIQAQPLPTTSVVGSLPKTTPTAPPTQLFTTARIDQLLKRMQMEIQQPQSTTSSISPRIPMMLTVIQIILSMTNLETRPPLQIQAGGELKWGTHPQLPAHLAGSPLPWPPDCLQARRITLLTSITQS